MIRPTWKRWGTGAALLALFVLTGGVRGSATETAPPAGIREKAPSVTAITHARVVTRPGVVLEDATVVCRNGLIEAVGAGVRIPADAAIRDVAGLTVYPGLIDAYAEFSGSKPGRRSDPDRAGPRYWNDEIAPEVRVDEDFEADSAGFAKRRSQGFAAALAAPVRGVIKGSSALVLLAEGEAARQVLVPQAAWHANFGVRSSWPAREYPTSPMGGYSLLRQALYDADWYGKAQGAWAADPKLPRPETNLSLEALRGHVRSGRPLVLDARDELFALRADRLGREFELPVIVRASGREYRRLDEIAATGRAFLVPVDFPKPPAVGTAEEAVDVPLEDLMHWDLAPENPARLHRQGVSIALTTDGLENPASFLERVRKAVERGLPADAALAAVTLTPARLFGAESRLGSIEAGKIANLVLTDGDLFARDTQVLSTWVEGREYPVAPRAVVDPRGTWEMDVRGFGVGHIVLEGKPTKLTGKGVLSGQEVKLQSVSLLQEIVSFRAPVDTTKDAAIRLFSGAMIGDTMQGQGLEDGAAFRWSARRTAPFQPSEKKKEEAKEPETSSFAVNYPLGMYGRAAAPEQPAVVAFVGGVIWTSGPQGVLENGTVLVRRGKIAEVGTNVSVPGDAVVVELHGRHVTAGLIDAHSHIATDGGINESGQTISAEVRIADFIDPNDISIYRQVAGGLTSSHIMHGSANTIGGQCQVIKLRWGAGMEAMKFAEAPPTIKFALGENVKQANWGDRFTTRYPQTRMGVEQLVRDEFRTAREYEARWAAYDRNRSGMPPRRDLELDAIVEVLNGRRIIHCHSYRQDEILALIRTCDDFGVKIGVLQHILEGYKVADEMASREIGGSTFSDWWAYKYEVVDAIPFNGTLMDRVGVLVSFNSDNGELARRMNTEAAKAVHYGGLSEEAALHLVTINPAKQLRVDHLVGSLEKGKQADIAVWSGSPLSTLSRCEETWIDGRRYFSLAEEEAARGEGRRMHAALVQKALRADSDGEASKGGGGPRGGYSCMTGVEEDGE